MKAIKVKYLLVGADTAGFPIKEAAERAAKGNGVNVLAMGAFFVTTHMACVISASGRAVWDFWRDEQLRLDGDGAIKLEVPPCDTRVVRLTPFSAQGATLLSVSRHITQGGYELASFRSDAHEVSGAVKCPGGETVKVTLLLPGSRGAITSSHPCKLEGDVLRLELSPVSSETVEWHVAF